MAFVDIHAHIYPEKIAAKAVKAVGAFYGVDNMLGNGTAQGLLAARATTPITHFVVHSVATTPQHVESINNFIAAQCAEHPEFIGFMTMHQDYENPAQEVKRALDLGLCGMKIHTDTQRVNLDDPRLMRVYEAIEGRLPIIIHTGDYRYDFSNPRRLLNVLKTFPNLVVDAAHFGNWSCFDRGYDILAAAEPFENLFVDTSSSSWWLGQRHTVELARLWGTHRVMFGSDFPMWSPDEEYRLITTAGFTAEELANITWHNAERFLGRSVD